MSAINRQTSLEELAVMVSQALERAGITATLSGGGAVSIYSENEYVSNDLDFVTSERNAIIAEAIAPLGFRFEAGTREFSHPDTDFFVEFPPGPLAFGETVVSDDDAATIQTRFGPLRVVTPTQSVMDRLSAYAAWNDNQALDQATMIVTRQPVDWPALYAWGEREGMVLNVIDRLKAHAGRE
jgi:hypothetical protein